MRPKLLKNQSGYSIFELVMVIIIIGILASVSLKSMRQSTDVARLELTLDGMENWTIAVAGDPAKISGGCRTDYGFVGDNGSLPPDMTALFQNSLGWSTWNGPYLDDGFNDGSANRYFDRDSWGKIFTVNGIEITSTGSGTTYSRKAANSIGDLLYNSVTITVLDLDRTPPGLTYKDSVRLILSYPGGSGSIVSTTTYPEADGTVFFDSIPIGSHDLKMEYLPTSDTLSRKVNINPGSDFYAEWIYYSSVWGSGS